jgi:putative phosphoesterase
MKQIGVLSDTHGFLHPRVFDFFNDCNEIWHAGDIGSLGVIEALENFKTTRAVYGNIDDHRIRMHLPEKQIFTVEGIKTVIIHIAGNPGKYSQEASSTIALEKPGLLIAGHSHILKVKYDQARQLLFINPGAAGIHGFHHKITMVRFVIDASEIRNLEVFEIDRKNISPNTVG